MNHKFDAEAVKAHALEIRQIYAETVVTNKINILNVGKPGTGKTRLAKDSPKPVLIHSFDRGGSKTAELKPLIDSGDIIVDRRFEDDDWNNPRAFRLWESEFYKLRQMEFFEAIGTFYLDSATTFADSMMYAILKSGGDKRGTRVGKLPEIQDYHMQQYTMVDYLNVMMSLPCHVVVNGHVTFIKDEVTGKLETGILLAGKASDKVPLTFDEKYISKFHGGKFVLQTKSDGYWHAETRVGGLTFAVHEEQNLYKLLKKAGVDNKDKPSLSAPVQKEVTS